MNREVIRVDTDDAIRNIRRVLVGVNGTSLPFEASYKAYGVFTLFAMLDLVLVIGVIGKPFLSLTVIYTLGVCVLLTKLVMRFTDTETPLRSLPRLTVAVARSGRAPGEGRTVRINPVLRVTEDPWQDSTQRLHREAT